MKPFRDSTDLVGDADGLRARAQEDGYLFLRGLLPAANLERARLEFLDVLRDEGYAHAEGYRDQLVNPVGIPEGVEVSPTTPTRGSICSSRSTRCSWSRRCWGSWRRCSILRCWRTPASFRA